MNAYQFPDSFDISNQAKSLIIRILKQESSKRPSLEDILNDEFFQIW